MFYCKECALPRNWPWHGARSRGRCEICYEPKDCADVPSRALPIPTYPTWKRERAGVHAATWGLSLRRGSARVEKLASRRWKATLPGGASSVHASLGDAKKAVMAYANGVRS